METIFQDKTPSERLQLLRENAASVENQSVKVMFSEEELADMKHNLSDVSIKENELKEELKEISGIPYKLLYGNANQFVTLRIPIAIQFRWIHNTGSTSYTNDYQELSISIDPTEAPITIYLNSTSDIYWLWYPLSMPMPQGANRYGAQFPHSWANIFPVPSDTPNTGDGDGYLIWKAYYIETPSI